MRPLAEKLKAAQETGYLQHYNDRYDSGKQSIDKMNKLQARHYEEVDVHKLDDVLHKDEKQASVGPTPYEGSKAGEDAWE